jgi:SAM-dependent methyltransferase
MLQGEVAAMNDTPTGVGFAIAHELLGSRVRRETLSVYDLSPERLGAFDVVFMSDLLLHLRDPQRALENVYSVTRPGGVAIIAEAYSEALESLKGIAASEFHSFTRPAVTWWLSSPATLQAMARVAGFEPVEEIARFRLECKAERPHPKVVLIGRRR